MAKMLTGMTDEELRRRASSNSSAWHGADAATRDALHNENVEINRILDQRNGSTSTYDSASGSWHITSAPKSATGYRTADSSAGYEAQLRSLLNRSRPEYTSRYADAINAAQNGIQNREPFSFDPKTSPVYGSYKKEYAREGQRAAADTLGQYAAMTGGVPSTAAVTASQQAGDYYAARMADAIPELYRLAYSMYQDEGDRKQQALNNLRALEQDNYSRYLDELGQYNTDRALGYTMQRDAVSDQRYADELAYQRALAEAERAYQRERDAVSDSRYADELAYQRQLAAANLKAQYDDYSGLRDLGVSPGLDTSTRLAIANAAQTLNNNRTPSSTPSRAPTVEEEPEEVDTSGATVTNRHGNSWVTIAGMTGRYTWQELLNMVESGRVEEIYDSKNNTLTYRKK